jgi:type II secretory pathway component PulJ
MKIYHNGFSMIEFLVYLCLFAAISIILMHFIVTSTLFVAKQSNELQHTLNFLTAMDLIAHELEHADAEKKQWVKIDAHSLIWHSEAREKDVGFMVIDKKLVRILGNYIPAQNVWNTKITNVIAENIHDFIINYDWDNAQQQLNFITYSLTGFLTPQKKYHVSRSVVLHNRYL